MTESEDYCRGSTVLICYYYPSKMAQTSWQKLIFSQIKMLACFASSEGRTEWASIRFYAIQSGT